MMITDKALMTTGLSGAFKVSSCAFVLKDLLQQASLHKKCLLGDVDF